MKLHNVKSLLVACFSILFLGFSNISFANDQPEGGHHEAKEEKFDAAKVIMEHIMDAHEFHFFSIGDFHAIIHLPVIIYSPERGLSVFIFTFRPWWT
jgi:F-type H+-transporting ATPase subunit a